MKLSIIFFVSIFAACRVSEVDKRLSVYNKNRSSLVCQIDRPRASMELVYFPSSLFGNQKPENAGPGSEEFYYFRFRAKLNSALIDEKVGQEALIYGIDSLFNATDNIQKIYPVLVQPVIKGGSRNLEYLIVFEKKSFNNLKDDIEIILNNTTLSGAVEKFLIRKSAIILVEKPSC